MENRTKIVNIICAALCIVLAVALFLMLYTENQKEKAQSEAIQAIQEEAAPYEKELQTLQNELSNLKDEVSYSSEAAKIMVGFVVSDVSDINYIAGKADAYGFSPILIINCTMEMRTIEQVVNAADETWEIMLYAPTFSEEVNEDVLPVISYLEEEGKKHTGIFLLFRDYCTDANIQLLKNDGFIGYTIYNVDSPKSGQQQDGTVYFDYSYLNLSSESVKSRIPAMYNNKASMLYAFDMASRKEGNIEENYIADLFDMLQSYTEKEDCTFSTVADVVKELSEINAIEANNQEEYEKQASEIQERMEELKETIAQIYEKAEY